MFMNHAIHQSKKYNLYVTATLTELIDNNMRILKSRINPKTIKVFFDMLNKKARHEKYVNILRALVNCDGEAVISN